MRQTTVIREGSSVTCVEVEGAGLGITDEHSRASVTLVEVKPFLSLEDSQSPLILRCWSNLHWGASEAHGDL